MARSRDGARSSVIKRPGRWWDIYILNE
jgi:hypothetical protein